MKRILVAGLGNIFFGDDAFGVEVAQTMSKRPLPPGVEVMDLGIRSYDLACALVDEYDAIILVDALRRGEAPGALCLIEPDLAALGPCSGPVNPHALDPVRVLQMAQTLGEVRAALYLVGCEPAALEVEDGRLGLSASVRAAVAGAIEMIESLVAKLLGVEIEQEPGCTPV